MAVRRCIVMALCATAAAGNAGAVTTIYVGELSGANESPPVASQGTGSVLLTYSSTDFMLRVQTTFSGLGSNDVAAHIHCCTGPGQPNAPVATMTPSFSAFPLGVTAGSYDHTFDMSQATSYNPSFITANGGTVSSALAVLLNGLANRTAYFNIHTMNFPGGEIRAPTIPDAIFRNGFD